MSINLSIPLHEDRELHPPKAEIRAYAADQLTKREAARITPHLAECEDCRHYEHDHRKMLKRWREYFRQTDPRLLVISKR